MFATVDGKRTISATANLARPDVGARYRGIGAMRGYHFRTLVAEGQRRVCVWATNVGRGRNAILGCRLRVFD